jgi:hypothetical protein
MSGHPTNSAAALHVLLTAVVAQGKVPISHAWAKTLGADYNTPEFANRHVEVVGLLVETARNINALQQSGTRERLRGYLPAWWAGVLAPTLHWQSTEGKAQSIIAKADLDQLGTAADLLEARLTGTVAAPAGNPDLTLLGEQCQSWQSLLEEAVEIPATLRNMLTAQLQHLVWLIELAPLFGIARVAEEAQAFAGAVVQASPQVQQPDRRRRWKVSAQSFVLALTSLTGTLTISQAALDAAAGNIQSLEGVITSVADLRDSLDGADGPATDD